MENEEKDFGLELLKGIAWWEFLLLIPGAFLLSQLDADNLFEIFLNVLIIIFTTIGLFATSSFIKKQRRKKE